MATATKTRKKETNGEERKIEKRNEVVGKEKKMEKRAWLESGNYTRRARFARMYLCIGIPFLRVQRRRR